MRSRFLRTKKQVSTYFHGVGLALLLSGVGCSAEPGPVPERPQAVRVVTVQQRSLDQRTAYVGTVRSVREIKVLARVAGTLAELPVTEGEPVESGDVLARIHAPDLGARLDQARAERQRAAAERDYACDAFATDEGLHRRGAISAAELDRSRRQCRSAEAAVRAAAAQTRELTTRTGERIERATVDGHVLEHLAEPGEYVTPGRPLVLVGDAELELEVAVSERDIAHGSAPLPGRGRIAAGTEVEIRLPGGRIPSEVRSVAPKADGRGRTFVVRIPLPAGFGVRHGMSVDVDFILNRASEGMAVPIEAVVRDEDGTAVFLVEDDVVVRHSVTTGIASDGWVALSSSLPSGSRVVVTNLDVLHDGASVYPILVEKARR
jgi:RND family efflux transporter MFP subunit